MTASRPSTATSRSLTSSMAASCKCNAAVRASAISAPADWLASVRLWPPSGAGELSLGPRRALKTAIAPTAARTTAMTIRTAGMIMGGGAIWGRSGADRQVEWVACLGDEPLGEEDGGGRRGASPIPAEGHGTRDRWVAKRDDRHTGARDREGHRHQRGPEAGLDQPLNDGEIVSLVGHVRREPLGGK